MPTSSLSLRLPWAQLQLKPMLLLPQAHDCPGPSPLRGASPPGPTLVHMFNLISMLVLSPSSHKNICSFLSNSSATLPTTTAEMLPEKPILPPPSPGPLQQGSKPRVLFHQPPGSLLVQSPNPCPPLNPPGNSPGLSVTSSSLHLVCSHGRHLHHPHPWHPAASAKGAPSAQPHNGAESGTKITPFHR